MARSRKQSNYHDGGEQLPLITPESSWRPLVALPDLRGKVRELALDRETRDDGLAAGRGSGWPYRAGRIVGVSAAWHQGAEVHSFYAPVAHPDTECLDPQQVRQWELDHQRAGVRFIYHSADYDCGWGIAEWGLPVPEKIDDVAGMAAIVDENLLEYNLDALARWRGLPGKDTRLLSEAVEAYGYSAADARKHIWRVPARYAGPYAKQDAQATLLLADNLRQALEAQDLNGPYQLEADLIPMVIEMRRRGVRIDVERAEREAERLLAERDRQLALLGERMGRRGVSIDDVRSSKRLEEWFISARISFPRTKKTEQGSFQAKWMRKHEHWLPQAVARIEQLTEAADKFLRGFLLAYAHRGRLHANINQFRNEEGGTRTSRFSYTDPPLQQMPARDEELSAIIRGCFLPEPGELWGAHDWSQQEYRLICHYAYLCGCTGARAAVERYQKDPSTDFHMFVVEITGLERKPAKDTNFAKSYGAGVAKFAEMIGKSVEEAAEIMNIYDEKLPFVKQLMRECERTAQNRGWIKLIDGARSHFDLWEPSYRRDLPPPYNGVGYMPERKAREWAAMLSDKLQRVVRVKRAFAHKAGNRLIQGSAARMMKEAMRQCWREGIVPLLQMHDELGFSHAERQQGERVAEIMRGTYAGTLTLPMLTDSEYGSTWGDARKVKRRGEDGRERVVYGATWEEAEGARAAN